VRVHQHGAGKKERDMLAFRRNRGGLTTKIHAAVDTLGNPERPLLTVGYTSKYSRGDVLIDAYNADYIVAYDSNNFVEIIEISGAAAVIPPRSNRNEPRE